MTTSKQLAPKTEAFCRAYAAQKTKNASAAYRASRDCSKMKTSTINSNAKKLLRQDSVRLRIADLEQERECSPDVQVAEASPADTGLTLERERFCQHYALHDNGAAAVAEVWPQSRRQKPQARAERASRLLADDKICARITALRAKVAEAVNKKFDVSTERIVQEYAKMGFANMLDYITVNKDGTAHCDLSKLTRDQAAAIQEMTFETVLSSAPDAIEAAGVKPDGDGKYPKVTVLKTKFKLHDKKGPLSDLGKHLGMFKADNEQAGKAAAEAMAEAMSTPRDLARAVLDILREAKVDKAPATAGSKA